MKKLMALIVAAGLALPLPSYAQDQTLADIRQELSVLYVDIQKLKAELNTTGAVGTTAGNSPLERLTSIEGELQRLTGKIEQLEYRINRITDDGTNRIGDLEFRLCELEAGCDIGALGDTPFLGGIDNASTVPTPDVAPNDGPALAVGERADFERAQAALEAGEFQSAADQFATFTQTYPGGPMSARAHYLRGEAFESLGQLTDAARAYLDAFGADGSGPEAPNALFKLGASLGAIGQVQDACITLAEVAIRFPTSEAVGDAQVARQALGCS